MSEPKLDLVTFEQLISFCPKRGGKARGEPCLRDMIFSYYESFLSPADCQQFTQDYTDKLYERFGSPKNVITHQRKK
jgi:hypothetical protein